MSEPTLSLTLRTKRREIENSIKAYEATKPAANWSLQCIPAAPAMGDEEVPEDGAPAEQ